MIHPFITQVQNLFDQFSLSDVQLYTFCDIISGHIMIHPFITHEQNLFDQFRLSDVQLNTFCDIISGHIMIQVSHKPHLPSF